MPFGIISFELIREQQKRRNNLEQVSPRVCKNCSLGNHDKDAHIGKDRGVALADEKLKKYKPGIRLTLG